MFQPILRRKQVEAYLGISRSSIYAMVLEGSFPKPLKIGRRSVGWRPEDIESWLLQKQETAEGKRA